MNHGAILPAAVIFDMDGVLVDTEPLHAECYVRIFAGQGLACTVEEYRRSVTLGHMDVRDVYISIGGDMARWPDAMAAKAVLMAELLSQRNALMPGAVVLLESLRAAGIPMALATAAGRRSMGIQLDAFDLRGYFDHFVTWEDVKSTKPDPEGFLIAAKKLGSRPEECVVIEDSPRGVTAASRAGIKCVAVPNGSTADGDFSLATLVVQSLEEVTLQTLMGLFARSIDRSNT